MKKIAVVGSINTDFVFTAKHLPKPSETIKGETFETYFGGKGANVSVAVSRLLEKVELFGAVGDDIHSKQNIQNLAEQKVNTENVEVFKNEIGGSACITVGDKTNSIMVVPGANGKYTKANIKKVISKITDCDVVATQLETDFAGVEYLIGQVYKKKKILVFNPSPIRKLSKKLLNMCSYIIVNEVEIKQLPGYKNDEQMLKSFNGRLILTKGGEGVFYYADGKVCSVPSIKTKVVNTTGAGDTFLAAFSVAILNDKNIKEAIEFANVCAVIKVGKPGTQTGMPTLKEVQNYLEQRGKRKMAVHVAPHEEGWQVKSAKAKKAYRVTKTQEEAIKIAKKVAKNKDTSTTIQGRHGKFRAE